MTIPTTYWGHPVDRNGLFMVLKDRICVIDNCCGTYYYGHDDLFEGGCYAWMRLRETVDRSHNDVHRMKVVNGIWELT
jgi:hypothetical protein